MRVLVTGSRTWRDGGRVRERLDHWMGVAVDSGDTEFVVVHGACKSGADSYADAWARWNQRHTTTIAVRPEPHPAKWDGACIDECQPKHRRVDPRGWDVCPAAGFYRNEHMVHKGAHRVLAFIDDESKGATHCAKYAETAGLIVDYFRTGSQPLF